MKSVISTALLLSFTATTVAFAHRGDPAEHFSRIDTDKSGGISLQEFQAGAKMMHDKKGKNPSPPDAARDAEHAEKFKAAAGEDQQLSLDEFKTMMGQMKGKHGHHKDGDHKHDDHKHGDHKHDDHKHDQKPEATSKPTTP